MEASPHISQDLRQSDRLRYLSSLLLSDDVRVPITVLFAFHAEIGRIRDVIKEPLPGEIRLQWWREVTADYARKDEAKLNPLADALNQVIDQYGLNRASFDGYCRARIFDLYDDPMPDTAMYEGYAGETSSMLLQLSAQIIDENIARSTADMSGHGGIAQAVAGHLANLCRDRQRGQLYVPMDILARHNLDRDRFLSGADKDAIKLAIYDFINFGKSHFIKAQEAYRDLDSSISQAYLPLHVVPRIFSQAEKLGEKCLDKSPLPPPWISQWDLWRGARRGIL